MNKYIMCRVISIFFLVVGILIYLLYRPYTILIFDLLDKINLLQCVVKLREIFPINCTNEVIIYSLPSCLWTASYLLYMYTLVRKFSFRGKLTLALLLPILALVFEFLQGLGLCTGTFDIVDVIFYIIPILTYIFKIVKDETTK